MRRRILLATIAASFFFAANVQAQDCKSNDELKQKLSIFSEYAKARNYNEAYPVWKEVYTQCPSLHYATFAYGERILQDRIKNNTAGQKAQSVKELIQLYTDYNKLFPTRLSTTDMRIRQALLMFDENAGSEQEIYDLLNKAFTEDRANFKNEKALYLYFSELVTLHEKGQKELQEVFDAYDNVSEKIQDEKNELSATINQYLAQEEAGTISEKDKKTLDASRKRVDNYETIAESIDAKLGQLADCQNLIPLYTKNFEANKTNEEWLRRAAGKMSDKDCTKDPLFVKIVTSLHNVKPSANSAYYLGVMSDKDGNSSKAIQYYNEAVNLETDNFKKSKLLIKIASKHSKAQAVGYAQKALTYNPSNSDAYRIMAHAYASSANECGSTSFEKRAVYWLAAQMARKGGLESLAARYDALAPSKADIFESGLAGKTISFKCWVGQSVTVPRL
jgi:secreted protein containing tetratricopeptide repeats